MTKHPRRAHSWEPHIDLEPPPRAWLSEVAAALDDVAAKMGFGEGWPWVSVQELEEDPQRRLHIHTAWMREPLHDDGIFHTEAGAVQEGDGMSLWGSGLVRIGINGQRVELLVHGVPASGVAAIATAYIDHADMTYRT
ncbi:hypothetical protein ACTWJ8_40695 (plasmid) [Streptomyces sp. SDT5-1]|uniref:hypothetical protein n=1 Tax=Streptomyces sp. SDT5-1 TaxID=3406418 RepID=UPI003FD2571A